MWEWWATYYHKALSLGVKFTEKFDHTDAKEIVKMYMQW